MESSTEFNSGRLFVAEQVFRLHREEYEALFESLPPLDDPDRFPQLSPEMAGCDPGPEETAPCRGKPGAANYDDMTREDRDVVTRVTVNIAKSIAAYVTSLRCGESRFDAWLDGDERALTRAEQRGAALFVGAAGCVQCHSGPRLTDGQFHNVGLRPSPVAVAIVDSDDPGASLGTVLSLEDPLSSAGAFSDGDRRVLPAKVDASLEGAFKTPTLRCIAEQPSFMHTGQMESLEHVVTFFVRGGDPAGYPGTNELSPLDLDERQRADLVAFISALMGPGPDLSLLAPDPD
jgi:cytochrome c peroxidase